mmetsp:Transcript_63033/g.150178  ORF Transcript_63033/g.150178 Transcript_63033/m.150178 type:complete len:203 (+) Transcript_63033:1494-2102(+)
MWVREHQAQLVQWILASVAQDPLHIEQEYRWVDIMFVQSRLGILAWNGMQPRHCLQDFRILSNLPLTIESTMSRDQRVQQLQTSEDIGLLWRHLGAIGSRRQGQVLSASACLSLNAKSHPMHILHCSDTLQQHQHLQVRDAIVRWHAGQGHRLQKLLAVPGESLQALLEVCPRLRKSQLVHAAEDHRVGKEEGCDLEDVPLP